MVFGQDSSPKKRGSNQKTKTVKKRVLRARRLFCHLALNCFWHRVKKSAVLRQGGRPERHALGVEVDERRRKAHLAFG